MCNKVCKNRRMPDKRSHRGPHPEDRELFSTAVCGALRAAADDLTWLLDRGYASTSSLKLVGDRHRLTRRQRVAVARCVSPSDAIAAREAKRMDSEQLAGQTLWIDGYNVLTTIEAALSGGLVLEARDGCLRDMASMHGSYRKVAETEPAISLIGATLASWNLGQTHWLFDRPVSNSGRLRALLLDMAAQAGWPWSVELPLDPDPILADAEVPVATSDSVILDRCGRWVNLAREVVAKRIPEVWRERI